MNGPEHYAKAEQLVHSAEHQTRGTDRHRAIVAEAQVHATLALAAATLDTHNLDGWSNVGAVSL